MGKCLAVPLPNLDENWENIVPLGQDSQKPNDSDYWSQYEHTLPFCRTHMRDFYMAVKKAEKSCENKGYVTV